MAPQSNSIQAAATQNAQLRALLLATAPRNRKALPTVTSGVGLTTRVKIFNVGIITGFLLDFAANVTIGTAVASASSKAPWNLINRIRVTDYDGTDRINLSGWQLYVMNTIRQGGPALGNNSGANAVISNPSVPTAIGAQTILGSIYIPLAFDPSNPIIQLQDLRGALLGQTNVGEAWITIDWNPTLITNGNVDAVYSGGATTTVVETVAGASISATIYQDYMLPQAVQPNGIVPIPMLDILTVYELNGNLRSTDNIILNSERLISFPNQRSVIGGYFNYVNNNALSAGMGMFRVIANGNNVLSEDSYRTQILRQRSIIDGDIGVTGVFWRRWVEHPIETALYGNVQMGLTPNAALTNPYIETAWESFYTKGQALPGLGQAQ